MNIDRLIQVARVVVFVAVSLGMLFWLVVWLVGRRAEQRVLDQVAERTREERMARLAKLVNIAERYDAAPESEKQQLYREAEALSDSWSQDDEPKEAA